MMMLILVTLYFVTFLPTPMIRIIGTYFDPKMTMGYLGKFNLGVTNMAQAANSCVNILVYTAMSR